MVLERVPCNICESEAADVLYSMDPHKIVKCKDCGLVYVNPRLKEEALKEEVFDKSRALRYTAVVAEDIR